ncbi:MAG: phosphate acyltransferase PlsX [Ignavibacterium sp.]
MLNSNNKLSYKIIVDAMGGDNAPLNVVLGSVEAVSEDEQINIILVGKKTEIDDIINSKNLNRKNISIVNANEIIDMGDSPTKAIKSKPDSSIVVSANLVNQGGGDAFVSAGNTGAVVAASTFIIGRLEGIERPTIGTFIPSRSKVTTLFDIGAFVDSKPQHLVSYAIMASNYVKEIYGIENPSIGILSVGEEDEKGNKLTKEAAELLRKTNLNFIGNIEGRDILKGKVNAIICDGFIGNILLKFGESFPSFIKYLLKNYASQSLSNKIKIGLVQNSLREVMKPFDYEEYGGVPLLGVKKVVIIGHGVSTPKAIKNMIIRAKEILENNLINKIENSITKYYSLIKTQDIG